ncbi:MAG: hypothetical protein K8S18_08955 [Desulfobacula sp.]|nr:hypothetical protein [Desulfobacula sp.]
MDDNLVELSQNTFKVDRLNFLALTDGMEKNNEIIKTAIYVTDGKAFSKIGHDFKKKPRLLTIFKSENTQSNSKKFTPSVLGKNLLEKYKGRTISSFEYAVVLSTIFEIKNKIGVWEKLCTNGIFDIWDDKGGPYKRLEKANNPKILLMRIYKINKSFSKESLFYHVNRPYPIDIKEGIDRHVLLESPVIEQNDFVGIYHTIKTTLKDQDAYLPEDNFNILHNTGPSPPSIEFVDNHKTDATTEKNLVSSIHTHIQNQGFTFDRNTIINYYLSLKTKPFVILSGITGTGKTKLTKLFADAV